MTIFDSIRSSKIRSSLILGYTLLTVVLQPFVVNIIRVSVTSIISVPAISYADAIDDSANAGFTFGQTLIQTPTQDGNIVYFEGESGTTESMNIDQLFQASGSLDDAGTLISNYGDNASQETFNSGKEIILQTEDSEHGRAYTTVIDSINSRTHPDLVNSPYLNTSKDILDGDDPIFDTFFSGCTEVPITIGAATTTHVPDLFQCNRVRDLSGSCSIEHTYSAKFIEYHSGPVNFASCGDGCLEIWIGRIGNNYWTGNCAIYEQLMAVEVHNPAAVTSATLSYATWDDYMQVYLADNLVWSGPNSNFPPETAGACELSTSWVQNPGVDVTESFKTTGVKEFKIRVSVTGGGEGYARITINYDPSLLTTENIWENDPDCMNMIQGIYDGACTGTIACGSTPPLDIDGCYQLPGIRICPDDVAPAPVTGISPFCNSIDVNADCTSMYVGDMNCYTNTLGELVCPTNDGGNTDTCTQYEANPECSFVSSTCLPEFIAPSGICYAFEETWDCGFDVTTNPEATATTIECGGPIRCMGESCVTQTRETNPDFGKASATVSSLTFASMDADCAVDTTTSNNYCEIFSGDPMTCKKALGGYVDCCERPEGISLADYFQMAYNSYKLANYVELSSYLSEMGMNTPGAWETFTNSATATWDTVTEPFTSAWGSLTENAAGEAIDTMSTAVDTLQSEIINYAGEFVADTFGPEVAAQVFTQEGGQYVLTSTVGTALSVIMWVYTIYLIIDILIKIIWECEQSEFELGAKRELRSCHYVGSYCSNDTAFGCIERTQSYCCYNSPLGRIVQEGAHDQLALPWGTAEAPQCDGMQIADMAALDWDLINLDEWHAILIEGGVIPNSTAQFDIEYDVQNVTSSDYTTVIGPSAPERIDERLNMPGVDIDATRTTVRDALW